MSWIGVDLDGTLALYDTWKGPEHIGEPIPEMLERVRGWLADGYEVKIFTARVSEPENIPYIERWLALVGLPPLEITNVKDFAMIELWDDRAVGVISNTGKPTSLVTSRLGEGKRHGPPQAKKVTP
jgi:hypothetical protein